ncbi:MAG: DsrE family protein [Candidatus Thiothrix putei]|uniref:DsrE family protein n=1 Tax=Candidatus Thiothrix putei TaxID=3080811 RepID=A0AA95KNB3_9GAMM|nr:MAG: DsrE family protein [Candidatus Thiothrix putei]
MRVNPFFAASMVAIALLSVPFSAVTAADAVTEKTSESEATGDETHRLVIQVNKREEDFQDHVLANIVNLQKHYGMDNIEMEVVAYGPGIWLVTDKSAFLKRVESLMMQNVTFTACGNTLDTVEETSGTRPTLIDGVEETQAGIARIIALQEQGWSYLSP